MSRSLQTVLACAVFCLAMPVRAQSVEPTVSQRARFQGTFLQLRSEHTTWTPGDWARLFDYFDRLQLSELILQWTVNDNVAFYPTIDQGMVGHDTVETILRIADQRGIRVSIGLVYDASFWQQVSGPPAQVETYLQGLEQRSAAVASELAPIARQHASFQGWYITQEVDDATPGTAQARAALFSYWRDLSSYLQGLTPNASVAISGFSKLSTDPNSLKDFWSALLVEAPAINRVLFQDGIGSGMLDLTSLPQYLTAVRDAVDANGRNLQIVSETFTQVGGPGIDQGPFLAIPAPLDRILSQLTIAAQFSADITAFSVPDYMCPLAGPAAAQLYQAYLAALGKGKVQTPPYDRPVGD